MMRKLIPFLIVFLVSTSSFATHQLQKLTVVLNAMPNPDHAPLLIAKEHGFFKAQGLEVTLITPNQSQNATTLIAHKKADIGITYQPEFMEQIDKGLPLIRVGTLIDKPLNCLVVLNGSGINSLADLKGKQIASSNNDLSNLMLKVMLAKQGLTNKDIALVKIHDNLKEALLSHKVAGVTGMMRNFEVPQLEASGNKVAAFFPEEHGVPNYSELIFIANTKTTHDKRFPKFMEAIKEAVAYLDAHPKETWQQFTKQYPSANNNRNRDAWFSTMPYFAEDPAEFDPKEWQRFAKFLQQHQLIKKAQPISRYAVVV